MLLLSNKNSFKLISSNKALRHANPFNFHSKRIKFKPTSLCSTSNNIVAKQQPIKAITKTFVNEKPISDEKRRLFLRAIGTIGLGALGVSLFPKKSNALIMGGAPASSIVGVKDQTNTQINPATEETLDTVLKTSDLTFDGTDLQVKVTSMPSGSSSSFSDSGDVPRNALVDADRHVQVDVLSSILPSSASTETTLQTIAFGGFKYALRMATVGDYDYIGEASIGSLTSSAVWRIKRIDNSSGLAITWAGTGSFDQIWDNYLSLTYS